MLAPISLVALGMAVVATRLTTRVVVSGESMHPGFRPGDRLLVVPVVRARPGQVVAVRDPGQPGRVLVKRVHRVGDDRVDLRGDNAEASTDSRHFGPVRRASVIGRVVYRYAPPERAGWLSE